MIDAMTPEQREHGREKTSRKDNAAAVKRYQARQTGSPVLRQRPGRAPIHVKPICRVAASCPLRSFCTVEGKGVA